MSELVLHQSIHYSVLYVKQKNTEKVQTVLVRVNPSTFVIQLLITNTISRDVPNRFDIQGIVFNNTVVRHSGYMYSSGPQIRCKI